MCIKSPLFKINKFSKTLYNLPNLSIRGLSWCPIGQIISQVKECFPLIPFLIHVRECEMDGGETFVHGVFDIQGLILSHLWVPLLRVCLLLSYQLFACHLKYSKLEMQENPSNSGVGLLSNSLHASAFMAVGENLIGQRCVYWFCWLSSGFLDPYDSPMKCQICYFDFKQNP